MAFIDDNDPLTDHADFGEDVGAQDDRVVLAQVLDELAGLDHLDGVDADGRLVHDDDFRLMDHRLRNTHALPVALR
ncbi:MAG: hypothetical protein JW395_0605 [Nitrospira sp.]|nr:hypothetical protein [Nitrospira sp.]